MPRTVNDAKRSDVTGAPQRPGDGGGRPGPRHSDGLTFLSYMIGGMLLYGGIGWLVGRWTNLPVLFPAGMIVGLGLAIALIIFRVTRS